MWLFARKQLPFIPVAIRDNFWKSRRVSGPVSECSKFNSIRNVEAYGDFRERIWKKHAKTLSAKERRQFREGTHPSQSHEFQERVGPFLESLREHLANKGMSAKVSVGFYHMDRIVLSVDLEIDPEERRGELPWLYRGFEVKYSWPPYSGSSFQAVKA